MYSEGQINLDKVDEHRHAVQLIFIFFSKGLAEQLIIFLKKITVFCPITFEPLKKQDVCIKMTVIHFYTHNFQIPVFKRW